MGSTIRLTARVSRHFGIPARELLEEFVDTGPHAGGHWFWLNKINPQNIPYFKFQNMGCYVEFFVAVVLYSHDVKMVHRNEVIESCCPAGLPNCINPAHWVLKPRCVSVAAPELAPRMPPAPVAPRLRLPGPRIPTLHFQDARNYGFVYCGKSWLEPLPVSTTTMFYHKMAKPVRTAEALQVTCRRCRHRANLPGG